MRVTSVAVVHDADLFEDGMLSTWGRTIFAYASSICNSTLNAWQPRVWQLGIGAFVLGIYFPKL
jgi:hypothetical protein